MSIVIDIINRARITLADKNAIRFNNDDLVVLMNEGIETFIELTKTLKQTIYLELETGITIYDISDYALVVERVEYLGRILEIKTNKDMDLMYSNWKEKDGTEVKYIIFSEFNKGEFRIYPRLTEGTADIIEQNSLYGGIIDIDFLEGLHNLPSADEANISVAKYLTINIVKKPNILTYTSTDDEYELNTSYNKAISAYIMGMALRNDESEQNRAFGNEQLSFFNEYVRKANKDSSENYTTALPRKVRYNTGFN